MPMAVASNIKRSTAMERISKILRYDGTKGSEKAKGFFIDREQICVHSLQERRSDSSQGCIQKLVARLKFIDGYPLEEKAMRIADKIGMQLLQKLAEVATNIEISIALIPSGFAGNNPRTNSLLVCINLSDQVMAL